MTTTTKKTARCLVAHDDMSWVTIRSLQTGSERFVENLDRVVLSSEEQSLVSGLMAREWEYECDLPYATLSAFKKLSERLHPSQATTTTDGVVEDPVTPVIVPLPSAPTPVVRSDRDTDLVRTLGRALPERKVYDSSLPNDATRIKAMQDRLASLDLVTIEYDIPEVTGFANPSKPLWRIACRTTKSMWTMPKRHLEGAFRETTSAWDADGRVVWKWRHVDARDLEMFRNDIQTALDTEIRRQHGSLIESIASADERLRKVLTAEVAPTPKEIEDAQKRTINSQRNTITLACKALDDLIACAETFDQSDCVEDLLTALRQQIRTQASLFNAEASIRGVKLAPTV